MRKTVAKFSNGPLCLKLEHGSGHRQTFFIISEKIRYQGEENDRKVFESSSPAKYKSNSTEDES